MKIPPPLNGPNNMQDNSVATTLDTLLNGRVRLVQPKAGYRVAIDPVLLAAAVPAAKNQRVCELGAGTGAATLCLNARVLGLSGALLEPDETLRALAETNMLENAAPFAVKAGRVEDAGDDFTLDTQAYDHVFCNPPFFGDDFEESPHTTRNAAHGESIPLAAWVKCARRALKPSGMLTCILPPARLAEWLAALDVFGAIELLPIAPRAGSEAKRVIIRAILGRKTPLELKAPFVLHNADGTFSDAANAVLRDAKALDY